MTTSGAGVDRTELRARLARRLSELYAREVPAYQTLVEVSREVNDAVRVAAGDEVERLGSLERVTAERHGAIRVGTPQELAEVAVVFAAAGMYPTGFYDLREANPAVPVVSTAFRPHDRDELARNPFRVFTSLLVVDDERFFDPELQGQLHGFLSGRELFSPELLGLSRRAVADDGLREPDAERYLELVAASLELSPEPIDRAWYSRLERVSSVAADIAGVASTHINHLTPRVLDIDALYAQMTARGITMIDRIQGPPRWHGPDVLLRQTSFRALDEPRRFRDADGATSEGELRVRFGEVEARGVALTPDGRQRYDEMLGAVETHLAEGQAVDRDALARHEWASRMPDSEVELAAQDLAYFTVTPAEDRPGGSPPAELARLAREGWVQLRPVVYEDFLPKSAAGIFASNLSSTGESNAAAAHTTRDSAWLSEVMQTQVADPYQLYTEERDVSLRSLATELGLDAVRLAGAGRPHESRPTQEEPA